MYDSRKGKGEVGAGERNDEEKSGKKEVKAEHTHPIKTFSMLKERSEVCQEMH